MASHRSAAISSRSTRLKTRTPSSSGNGEPVFPHLRPVSTWRTISGSLYPPHTTILGRLLSHSFAPDRAALQTAIRRQAPTKPLCPATKAHISARARTCWAAQSQLALRVRPVAPRCQPQVGAATTALTTSRASTSFRARMSAAGLVECIRWRGV